jgi:UDP-N-acetylglucosamine diphosphorylase/glucosamine-1-phosphate N-acetyltransferase
MNYILFDDKVNRGNLLPLTFTRPIADIRVGILTIREKWEHYLNAKTSSLTEGYLQRKFPIISEKENILINGSICPNADLITSIHNLKSAQALVCKDSIVAMKLSGDDLTKMQESKDWEIEEVAGCFNFTMIQFPWDVFSNNGEAIKADFKILTKGRKSKPIDKSNYVKEPENVFIEEGAVVEAAYLNASSGPIYIGKDSVVMEGAKIRGPFALCDHSTLKMDAKIYGPTTIGPHSKVGGEVNNSVIIGYSNKAHDGFIGQAVIGEWCNLGADTNSSNLKNTYDNVRAWNYPHGAFVDTGLQFCGLIMGDHSKTGINTMLNTGTVIGVNANVFGSGFPRTFIPSFSWGGPQGFHAYNMKKAFNVAEMVMSRRNIEFDQTEKDILTDIYNQTYKARV